jgi:cyclase
MLKKRIIFTLLYDNEFFMLSRNFRLQRVGNLAWLQKNYNFEHIAFFIDELIVLDVTRGKRDLLKFAGILKDLTAGCFVPIAAGGGVHSTDDAGLLLRSGADKIVVNTSLFKNRKMVKNLIAEFGRQCVVGSVDLKHEDNGSFEIFVQNGEEKLNLKTNDAFEQILDETVGELYLNSIDKDGTGQGYDFSVLDCIPKHCQVPVILAGGVGNWNHLKAGLSDFRVDAVATAHLFNFVGDGLQKARENLLGQGIDLARWPSMHETLIIN